MHVNCFLFLAFFFINYSLGAQCTDIAMKSLDGATVSASGTGGLCFGCSVSDEANVINADTTDQAEIGVGVGVGGYGYIRLALPQTYPAGTRVGWYADVNGGIGGLFNGITLVAYNNGSQVATVSSGSLFNIAGLGGGTNINGVFCSDFDEIEIRMGSTLGVFANYKVYFAYITDACTFPIQCGGTSSTEICGDNIDNDGNGLVDNEDTCIIIDTDGDGVADDGTDTDTGDACVPTQSAGYTGYDANNTTWQAADCDGDGVTNGQEVTDSSDPYDANSFLDGDGDGVADNGTTPDADPSDPCIPIQTAGYTDYDATNMTWANADCDSDGVTNGQELTDSTDPYDANSFLDADGDGVADTGVTPDSDSTDPCIPAQNTGYTGYDSTNTTWQAADCDGDGVTNGQEVTDGTDPYESNCSAGSAIPIIIKN